MSKRGEVKAEIMRQVEARVEKALGDDEAVAEMTLTEIEELALAVGAETGRAMTATLVAASGTRRGKKRPDCPGCGQAMRHKGYRDKAVITRTGEVVVRRVYYYCERCRKGIFPPG